MYFSICIYMKSLKIIELKKVSMCNKYFQIVEAFSTFVFCKCNPGTVHRFTRHTGCKLKSRNNQITFD